MILNICCRGEWGQLVCPHKSFGVIEEPVFERFAPIQLIYFYGDVYHNKNRCTGSKNNASKTNLNESVFILDSNEKQLVKISIRNS